ncbi:hypothetical protein Tco_0548723 [Tanacetum coccineum]
MPLTQDGEALVDESPLDLEAFSDSDYGGSNLDRKSTTGGCQFLGQRLISWQCKKQTIVATSTTEAEYVAAAHCCGQVLWVQNQLLDYGFNFMNTKIHIDNESTICIVKNPVYHSKTKHIEIRHHFIRDCYEKKLISVEKIHTDLNVADLLTKPFDGPRFNYLVVSIGLVLVLLGVEKSDARSTWAWKRKCQVSLANWMQFGLDFLRRSKLRYALTHNPPIYDSLVKQFWQTATARTLENGTQQLSATIDSTEYTITEESVRRQLQLADASGINMLQNEEIFAGLQNIGSFQGIHRPLLPAMLTIDAGQPQPSAAPSPTHPVPRASPVPTSSQPVPPPSSSHLKEKVKKLENKLKKKRKRKETEDAEGQDQEVPSQTDQENTFATPEKSKGSGEAQEEQITNKKHAELKSKSFEEIQVLYERYKKQDQTFVAIGTEEDEKGISNPLMAVMVCQKPYGIQLTMFSSTEVEMDYQVDHGHTTFSGGPKNLDYSKLMANW